MAQIEHNPFQVAEEIFLLEQIKDIHDELHTFEIVLQDQKEVIDQFCKLPMIRDHDYGSRALRSVDNYQAQMKRLAEHADHTYKTVRTR